MNTHLDSLGEHQCHSGNVPGIVRRKHQRHCRFKTASKSESVVTGNGKIILQRDCEGRGSSKTILGSAHKACIVSEFHKSKMLYSFGPGSEAYLNDSPETIGTKSTLEGIVQ